MSLFTSVEQLISFLGDLNTHFENEHTSSTSSYPTVLNILQTDGNSTIDSPEDDSPSESEIYERDPALLHTAYTIEEDSNLLGFRIVPMSPHDEPQDPSPIPQDGDGNATIDSLETMSNTSRTSVRPASIRNAPYTLRKVKQVLDWPKMLPKLILISTLPAIPTSTSSVQVAITSLWRSQPYLPFYYPVLQFLV
jgi:hypothetical protein